MSNGHGPVRRQGQRSAPTICSNMSTLDAFTCPAVYKYKTRWFSLSTIVVASFACVAVIVPFVIVYNAGGFWIRNRVFAETPVIEFQRRYLLIAEREFPAEPVVCSTFSTYKNNPISDDCIVVKVRDVDVNRDRKNDILKFEAQFYTDKPIRTLKLLLFFDIELKEIVEATTKSIAVFDCTLTHDVQHINFIGDLTLHQKSLLRVDSFPEMYNYSTEIGDKALSEVLSNNARRKLSARLTNTQVTWETGFSDEDPFTVTGEIFYSEQLIHYQPGFWEEIKWAWMQYFSMLLVFTYLTTWTLKFLFTHRYLKSYVVMPWKQK